MLVVEPIEADGGKLGWADGADDGRDIDVGGERVRGLAVSAILMRVELFELDDARMLILDGLDGW